MYKKNMKLGNKTLILSIKFFFLITYNLYGNEEISTSQLINIEKIKPSFEEVEEKNEEVADKEVTQMCEKLLANLIIEDYKINKL